MAYAPQYITQIDKDWFRKVDRATNLKAGKGIKIEQDGDGLRLEMDPEVFKQWLWTCIYRDMIYAPPGGDAPCRPNIPLGNLKNILVDPFTA